MQKIEIQISDQLVLREAETEDAEIIFRAIDSHREDLRLWLPFVDHLKQVADEAAFLAATLSVPDAERNYALRIEFEQTFCGLIGFVNTDTTNHKTEIGYWLLPPFRGRGIMTSCVRHLCKWAFQHRAMNRIQIKCAVGNHPSNAIPQRLNFRLEGVERDGELLASGTYTDLHVYSLLQAEFSL